MEIFPINVTGAGNDFFSMAGRYNCFHDAQNLLNIIMMVFVPCVCEHSDARTCLNLHDNESSGASLNHVLP